MNQPMNNSPRGGRDIEHEWSAGQGWSGESGEYRTMDFNIACFLYAKKFEFLNIEPTGNKRSYFVFRDTPSLRAIIDKYNFSDGGDPDILVDARKYAAASRHFKAILY